MKPPCETSNTLATCLVVAAAAAALSLPGGLAAAPAADPEIADRIRTLCRGPDDLGRRYRIDLVRTLTPDRLDDTEALRTLLPEHWGAGGYLFMRVYDLEYRVPETIITPLSGVDIERRGAAVRLACKEGRACIWSGFGGGRLEVWGHEALSWTEITCRLPDRVVGAFGAWIRRNAEPVE